MNYRHSFHAGNSADVVKHCLLIALVRALQLKESALTLAHVVKRGGAAGAHFIKKAFKSGRSRDLRG